jgi:hypothetical protein
MESPMSTVDQIFKPYEKGHAAVLLSDRSLLDLEVDPADRKLGPLVDVLRREARRRHGLLCVTYSMAADIDWQPDTLDQKDRAAVESELRKHGFLNVPQDENEVVRIMRAIASLARTRTDGLNWTDGRAMRFALRQPDQKAKQEFLDVDGS